MGIHRGAKDIPIVPLYLAQPRPVVERAGTLIVVDDDRLPLLPDERPRLETVRFRTLGCYPLSGAIRSTAATVEEIIAEIRRRAPVGAAGAADRPRRRRVDGEEEARGLLLMRPRLRLLTCGSVDDGKSTLIGRLLHDAGLILDDQLDALADASRRHGTTGDELDFALLLDGLDAEREQGITIDVAYRYFATARRAFIVADTPGHEQYTRNMATGASNCELAVILVDARKGLLTQTLRHATIVSLLGIRHVVLAVNKMDLVEFRPAGVRRDRATAFASSPRR